MQIAMIVETPIKGCHAKNGPPQSYSSCYLTPWCALGEITLISPLGVQEWWCSQIMKTKWI